MQKDRTLDYILHYKTEENLPLIESALSDSGYIQKNKTESDTGEVKRKTYLRLTHAYAVLLYGVPLPEAEALAGKISRMNQTLDEKIDIFPASEQNKFTPE